MQVGAMSQVHDGRLETPCATRCIRGRGLFKRSRRMRSSIGDPSLAAHLSLVRVVTVTVLFRPRRTERRTTDPRTSPRTRSGKRSFDRVLRQAGAHARRLFGAALEDQT